MRAQRGVLRWLLEHALEADDPARYLTGGVHELDCRSPYGRRLVQCELAGILADRSGAAVAEPARRHDRLQTSRQLTTGVNAISRPDGFDSARYVQWAAHERAQRVALHQRGAGRVLDGVHDRQLGRHGQHRVAEPLVRLGQDLHLAGVIGLELLLELVHRGLRDVAVRTLPGHGLHLDAVVALDPIGLALGIIDVGYSCGSA